MSPAFVVRTRTPQAEEVLRAVMALHGGTLSVASEGFDTILALGSRTVGQVGLNAMLLFGELAVAFLDLEALESTGDC